MKSILVILLLVISQFSFSDDSNTVSNKDYQVFYNAFPSTFLTPEVAKNYQIERSANRGLFNISIRKKNNDTSKPAKAKLIVSAKNLLGQEKLVDVKEIIEAGEAIYYIGSFSVSEEEVIHFNIDVIPENSQTSLNVKFTHEF
ncbi:MAG TPA: DUF4426 domain-containing protein [Gammaproteobacteria bacterium]|nr:DUF4426 domain-containing protein [Xanthomonadales bacterium]MCB1594088.1 DUF4426 domain-containing protein [Xanthomonadales bacterium]HOP22290.1 DUF4426 domain-containing protein [Gammaproteobacteria bacterium]HPI95958.1 DUF4426 domain-containing protein [Gammaproteobacteria bacterium]HPQ87413.1 DUF4426 domain-containing protein [Gammaproteobacteria bacterium]